MKPEEFHSIPAVDPITGSPLHVSELTNRDGDVVIRGKFALPMYARLDPESARFLEVFLRCRGILSSVEKELGLSYPTVRNKLDQLLSGLGLTPIREAGRSGKNGKVDDGKDEVLDMLERGEITPEDAKRKLRETAQ